MCYRLNILIVSTEQMSSKITVSEKYASTDWQKWKTT